jgi:AcrR family transcriptional regulator
VVVVDARVRILRAVVEVLAERGFGGSNVGLVVKRARVSRRTFAELFDGLDDCVAAVIDGTLRHGVTLASDAFAEAGCWRDGLRGALAATLGFLDVERELARVVLVESLAGGPVVCEHREHAVEAFRALVVARIESEVPYAWPLASEAMLASVLGVLQARLVARDRQPLMELLAPMMATLMAPYGDARTLAHETECSQRLARATIARHASDPRAYVAAHAGWMGVVVPALLVDRRSRWARECLAFVAQHPGCSNRELAAGVGLAHPSQASNVLSRLERHSLLRKHSDGIGRVNSWHITSYGHAILRTLNTNTPRTSTSQRQRVTHQASAAAPKH